jgi:hypothetical protein
MYPFCWSGLVTQVVEDGSTVCLRVRVPGVQVRNTTSIAISYDCELIVSTTCAQARVELRLESTTTVGN